MKASFISPIFHISVLAQISSKLVKHRINPVTVKRNVGQKDALQQLQHHPMQDEVDARVGLGCANKWQENLRNVCITDYIVAFIAVDDVAPVIQNCEDVTATVGLNIGGVVVTYDEPSATDNSGVVNLASRSRSPGQFFVVGSTAVTYRFVDGSGNFAECTFNVIVVEGKYNPRF